MTKPERKRPKLKSELLADNAQLTAQLADMELQRDSLKVDNDALVKAIEHQCNWLQDMAAAGGKLDADNVRAMSDKLRHSLAMHDVYDRSKPSTTTQTLRGAQ